jgi:hypothetical protein
VVSLWTPASPFVSTGLLNFSDLCAYEFVTADIIQENTASWDLCSTNSIATITPQGIVLSDASLRFVPMDSSETEG